MRIIAGEFRSIKLETLEDMHTRPTLDKVKGAVFSSIGNKIYDSSFLDLFSGSGAIGLEAKSRGASFVVMNDMNNKANKIIQQNINKTKANVTLYKLDYQKCLQHLANSNNKFDIIYLDPPFNEINYDELLNNVVNSNILSANAIIVVEMNKDNKLESQYGNYHVYKQSKYGSVIVTYFKEE